MKQISKTITKLQIQTLKSINTTNLHFHAVAASYETQSIPQAHNLFDKTPQPDNNNNHILFDHSRNNRNDQALNVFINIKRSGSLIDGSTLSCVLKVCTSLYDHNVGKQVHCECFKSGFFRDVSVGTALIDMYMKNGDVEDGVRVFDWMEERNVVSWTTLIAGFTRNGLSFKAVETFCEMLVCGVKPNPLTFASVLGALAGMGMVGMGRQVHGMVVKKGFESTRFVGNSLVSMYLKSGMVRDGKVVFDSMEDKDTVSWNGMIAGYVTNGLDVEALQLFYEMRVADMKLTEATFVSVLRVSSNYGELSLAKQLHCQALKIGFGYKQNIETAIMVAYSKCNEINDAFRLFSKMRMMQNVVSWTAIITAYLQNGEAERAVDLFRQMQREGVRPNDFTYSVILTAHLAVSPFQIHAQVIKSNYENTSSVGTALLDAYVKLGIIDQAANVFYLIEEKDIVAWSAMLAAYAQAGDTEEAVKMFLFLVREGFKPNEYTFSSVIHACAASLAAADQGKQFHTSSIKSGYSDAFCVSSALVTMYAKRGNIETADEVFKDQRERDLISWNTMISGYAQHGHGEKALQVFEEMRKENLEMDGITFIGVITACTHAGLMDEGQRYFDMMVKDYHIIPTMEHYSCMVDLYSRAGMLLKAVDIVKGMPYPAGSTVWRTLLAACRVHRDVELGKLAAENLISIQPQDSAAYVLLSNLYAVTGNWRERAAVRKLMDKRKVKKEAGYSWIEVKNKTHTFLAGDVSHPLKDKIYVKLDELNIKLREAGYHPDTNYVLQDVDEEHKEAILSHHSERLAIAFGLITTPPGFPIQIVKNLRVCGDCHTVIKLISMLEDRYIVVRDSNRFHHFKGGLCSCGDYW